MTEFEINPENSIPLTLPEKDEILRGLSIDIERVNTAIIAMLVDPSTDDATLREAWALRAVITEEFVDSIETTPDNSEQRARVQLYLMVDKAHIFEKSGNIVRYLDDLDTAEGFAFNYHFDALASSIGEEIDSNIAELDESMEALVVKLRPHVSFANREYLRELIQDGADTDDLVGDIYGMILDEGGDPDEVLASLGVTQD